MQTVPLNKNRFISLQLTHQRIVFILWRSFVGLMVLKDLQLTHLVGLNLGDGDPTKGMIELNESHPSFDYSQTNLRKLYTPISKGWFTRDVYDVYGITTCATTVWAREAFSLGHCLTYHYNTTDVTKSYRLTCTSGECILRLNGTLLIVCCRCTESRIFFRRRLYAKRIIHCQVLSTRLHECLFVIN